jgi:hypothetical protein
MFSLESYKAKQPVTKSLGETMVQVCLRRDHSDESESLGYLWHCKSEIIGVDNNPYTDEESYSNHRIVSVDLVTGELKKASGNVDSKATIDLFVVEVNNSNDQLTFKKGMPLRQDLTVDSNGEYIFTTTVSICAGKVDFTRKSAEVMLSDDCFYTYKKHEPVQKVL